MDTDNNWRVVQNRLNAMTWSVKEMCVRVRVWGLGEFHNYCLSIKNVYVLYSCENTHTRTLYVVQQNLIFHSTETKMPLPLINFISKQNKTKHNPNRTEPN